MEYRGKENSIRYKINGIIIFTIKSKMWISSTCENINEVRSKISSTKSDLRISKISHSFEVHISEIRERTDFRKTQCLKLQQTCWTWKTIYTNCIHYRYVCANRVYIVARTRSWNEFDFCVWNHRNNTFYAGWSICVVGSGSFEIYTSDKKSGFESTILTRSIYFCGRIKVIQAPRFDDHHFL